MEKVRRAQKVNKFSVEQAIVQLGVVNEVQIAQALAAEADLPYVKINPLDLDLDVVTKGVAGPFARRHGMVAIAKTADRITVAVHNPFAPFPRRGHQARHRPRRRSRRGHPQRRGEHQQGVSTTSSRA